MSFNNSSYLSQETSSLPLPDSNPAHLFCEMKSDINKTNEYGWTPWYRAIISNNFTAIVELLKWGADPNIPNNMSETPLFQTIETENLEIFTLLLDNKAECNIAKSDGNTPLHLSVKKQNYKFIHLLLAHNANPNLQNKLYQQTPLHWAIQLKSDPEIIKWLVKYHAGVDVKDKYDSTPWDYLKEDNEYQSTILNLLQTGTSAAENSNINNITIMNNNNSINNISNIASNQSTPMNLSNSTNNLNDLISKKPSNSDIIKSEFTSNTPQGKGNGNTIQDSSSNGKGRHEGAKTGNNKIKTKIINPLSIWEKNKIKTQKTKRENQISNFNLSTPIKYGKTPSHTLQKENGCFTLDHGVSSFNAAQGNKTVQSRSWSNRDIISEMNPLDLINPVITITNKSGIFSELQSVTMNNLSSRNNITNDDICLTIKTPEKDFYPSTRTAQEIINEVEHENGYENCFEDSLDEDDMSYSKSKSIIVSELPTSMKKNKSSNKFDAERVIFDTSQLWHPNKDESEIPYQETQIKPTSYHRSSNAQKGSDNKENCNTINIPCNIIPLPKELKELSSSKSFYELNDSERTCVNNNTLPRGGKTRNTYLNTSGNNVPDSENIKNNQSNLYSVNSTKPATCSNANSFLANNSQLNYKTNQSNKCDHTGDKDIINMKNNTNITGIASITSRGRKKSLVTEYGGHSEHWAQQFPREDSNNLMFANNIDITNLPSYTNINNEYSIDYRSQISTAKAKRLHEWLLSCDWLSYYNSLLEKGVYEIDTWINGIKQGDLSLAYKDIEEIGIKKPGHAYRFLWKMYSDAFKIEQKVIDYILPTRMIGDAIIRDSQVHFNIGGGDSCCGCGITEEKKRKNFDVDSWLRCKGWLHLRENFLHNGFDIIEYLILQMFSSFIVDDNMLIDHFHIYTTNDRKKLLKELLKDKKNICVQLGIPFCDLEIEGEAENCEACLVF